MPYKVRKVVGGYQVFKERGRTPFSKEPLSKIRAEKQKTAIILSELRKQKRIPPRKL